MAGIKKYTLKGLEKKVNKYFSSISRTITLQERVPNGLYTQKGEPMFDMKDILNDENEPIRVRQFLVPPSISALCIFLCISRQTWDNYSRIAEYAPVVTEAKARIEAYLEGELVGRAKGVEGIKFNLMQNYDWRDKFQISEAGVEEYLKKLSTGAKDEF